MLSPRVLGPATLGLALLGTACSSLDSYTTAPGESYCGTVTATASFRAGVPEGIAMRLVLDGTALDGETSPGTVWTSAPSSGTAPLLTGVALQRIPALENDALSTPDLGGGRGPTRLFALAPTVPGEAALLAVISLRSDDGVEVRLVRPGLDGAPPPGQAPLFGLFNLTRQAGTCGF
jgi:hypothetical protein